MMQEVTNSYAKALQTIGFTIWKGWSDGLARHLVSLSREPEIMKWAPRDANERFVSEKHAHAWYGDSTRTVYALEKDKTLGGLAWFSKKSHPVLDAHHTFAIRLYDSAREQGLAGAFLEATHADFKQHMAEEGFIWLMVDNKNTAALHLYEKHGYEPEGQTNDRLLMTRYN